MDIRKAFRKRPIGNVETSLGFVYVYPLTVRDSENLKKNLGKPIKSCGSKEFAKSLFILSCYPVQSAQEEEKLKPENQIFTLEETSKLSDSDLEKFAKEYIDGNEWLYKQMISKPKKEDGKEIVYVEYGKTLHPLKGDENFIDYLLRLHLIDEKKKQERYKKMLGQVSLPDLFTNGLEKKIRDTLGMGTRLSESLEPFRSAINRTVNDQISITPIQTRSSIDFEKIGRLAKEGREKPFRELGDKINQVTGALTDITDFAVTANETQTYIVAEIKSSSDSANKSATTNIKLTNVVIVISVVSLFITIFFRWNSTAEKSLLAIKNSVISAENLLLKSFENAASQSKNFKKSLKVLEQLQTKIDELSSLNNQKSQVIADLKGRVANLENSLKNIASPSIKP